MVNKGWIFIRKERILEDVPAPLTLHSLHQVNSGMGKVPENRW